MRLKSDLWVSAYLRRANQAGAFAAVVRRGDGDAGAIYIKVSRLNGTADLYAPAMPSLDDVNPERKWECRLREAAEQHVDQKLQQEQKQDSDAWLLEVEDRNSNSQLLPEEIATETG